MAKARTPIPTATAAAVLFASDRTCCVCRQSGKPIQIHHLDENPTNHAIANLAVLCLDCHDKTQLTGGFARRLDSAQIELYRDNWLQLVAADRSTSVSHGEKGAALGELDDPALVTSLVEVDREAGNFVNLAFVYDAVGNRELRDKAIEEALAAGATGSVQIMLRRLQGRIHEVSQEVIQGEFDRLAERGQYRSQAVLYEDLGRYREAAEVYLRGLVADLDGLTDFTLAHHLQELLETEIVPGLFVQALQDAANRDDFWWQVRALEELGWDSELEALVLEREASIAADPAIGDWQRAHLLKIAARAKGDRDAYRRAQIELEKIDAEIDWNS